MSHLKCTFRSMLEKKRQNFPLREKFACSEKFLVVHLKRLGIPKKTFIVISTVLQKKKKINKKRKLNLKKPKLALSMFNHYQVFLLPIQTDCLLIVKMNCKIANYINTNKLKET